MADEDQNFSFHKFPSLSLVVEELKELWGMAIPITAAHLMAFFRSAISVLFLGKLGSLELAGGALSIGFTNITGYSVLVGLASGLEPVCSQAYGCQEWKLLSLSLQRMVFVLLVAIVPISLLWLNLESIMNFTGQDPSITAMAGTYCVYSLPDLLINSLMQPLRVFLRSQKVTKPIMYCSLLAVTFHVPLNYLLVVVLKLGVAGVAIASVVTNFNIVVLMVGYVWWGGHDGRLKMVWTGGVRELWDGVGALLKLALPSCLAICLEWWWYEIVIVMAGYLPNPTLAVAATGVLIQTTSMMYTVPMALAGCVSARVGNELGAGNPQRAKLAAMVSLACAFLIGIINVIWTVILRRRWASLFTKDDMVNHLVASVLPIIGLCELGNCPQTTGCGILRGTARPAVGARINLGSFYLVGTPVAIGLAFGFNLGFSGLWFGLLSAQVTCVALILYVLLSRTDWKQEAAKAKELTRVEMSESRSSNGIEVTENEADEEKRGLLINGNGV